MEFVVNFSIVLFQASSQFLSFFIDRTVSSLIMELADTNTDPIPLEILKNIDRSIHVRAFLNTRDYTPAITSRTLLLIHNRLDGLIPILFPQINSRCNLT